MAGQLDVIPGATWEGVRVRTATRMPSASVLLGLAASPWRAWATWSELEGIVDDPRVQDGDTFWSTYDRRNTDNSDPKELTP